jgi:hypothetical protein
MNGHLLGPESCICPICKGLMRLYRVPALRALDTIECYLRCDACDHISDELSDITANSVCDVSQPCVGRSGERADWITECERELSKLMQAYRSHQASLSTNEDSRAHHGRTQP